MYFLSTGSCIELWLRGRRISPLNLLFDCILKITDDGKKKILKITDV